MDNKKKRIIAREYIMLMIVLLIGILTYLSTIIYNLNLQRGIKATKEKIKINKVQIDSLSLIYREKSNQQVYLFEKFKNEFDVSHMNTIDTFWARTEHVARIDSFRILWETKWDRSIISAIQNMGFKTPDDLQNFVISNSYLPIDLKNDSLSILIRKNNEDLLQDLALTESKVLSRKGLIKIVELSLIISFSILFILRYLVILLKWSIKTLNN